MVEINIKRYCNGIHKKKTNFSEYQWWAVDGDKKLSRNFKKKFSAYWRNRIVSPSWARAACSRSSCCWRAAGTPWSRCCRRRTGSGRPGRGWCAACTPARTPLHRQLASALYTHHVAAIQIIQRGSTKGCEEKMKCRGLHTMIVQFVIFLWRGFF